MPLFLIDEVCPKDSVYPMVVSFQNVYVTEKFRTQDCLLLEDEKTGKKNIITELCDVIYTGEEENEDLGKTLILARNKTTGKVRLIEVGNIGLKPVIKSHLDTTEAMDPSYLEQSRKFESQKHKHMMEQREELKINVQTVTKQPYKCITYQSSVNLFIDLKKLKHIGEKPYKCHICQSSFKQSCHLKRHILIHPGEKPYKCDICQSSFIQSYDLKRHILIHTGEKPYKCHVCQKSYKKNFFLKRHITTHTCEKPYKCDMCHRCFKQSSQLKSHIRIHTGEKPYKCNMCQSSFNQSRHLKSHIRIHTGEKPYKCDICQSSFNQSSNLRRHIRIHPVGQFS